MKHGELTLRISEEEVKFKPTKTVKFTDEDKGTCIKIDILIPLVK